LKKSNKRQAHDETPTKLIRINKYLSTCELGSRRKVEELIRDGKVKINGVVSVDLSTMVNPETDEVQVNRKLVSPQVEKIFIMLNKPVRYIVTRSDEFKRRTIYDLLPEFAQNLFPIGRLDYQSEGLVILTNDGDIANKIAHPKNEIEKIYKVIVRGCVTRESVEFLRTGNRAKNDNVAKIKSTDKKEKITFRSAKIFVKSTSEEKSELRVGIHEGQNRQIRRMFELVGHEVISLKRLQIGEIKLEKLPVGMWRFLRDSEVLSLVKR
jgi:23S rRNA pseudouridine2605 synthase